MKQYEVWWAELPSPPGRRPVLLLSRDAAYCYLNKFVAAEITTTVRGIAVEVPLGRREGLAKACAANLDDIRTISKQALVKKAGTLSRAREIEVKKALGFALAWPELIGLDEDAGG